MIARFSICGKRRQVENPPRMAESIAAVAKAARRRRFGYKIVFKRYFD